MGSREGASPAAEKRAINVALTDAVPTEADMPDLLIRNLDERTLAHLRARARRHGRSLHAEVKLILEQAARVDRQQVRAVVEQWQQRFADRSFEDSVDLLREDRER